MFFLIVILLLFSFSYSKYKSFPFSSGIHSINDVMYAKLTIQIYLGRPSQVLNVSLSSTLYAPVILDGEMTIEGFKKEKSSTYIEDEKIDLIQFRHSMHYLQTSKDILNFNSYRDENANFNFYFDVNYNSIDTNGGVLGLDYQNNNWGNKGYHSFIDQLVETNHISRNVFTIDYKRKVFIVGEDELLTQRKRTNYYKICNLIEESKGWICEVKKVNGIGIEESLYGHLNQVLFMIDFKFINVPRTIFDWVIVNQVITDEIKSKTCRVNKSDKDNRYITCNKDINFDKVKPITFQFENFTITIEGKDLFYEKDNSTYIYAIVDYPIENRIIIGESILKLSNYEFYFDKDNHHIGVYLYQFEEYQQTIRTLFISNSIFLIIGIIFCAYKYKHNI